MASASFWVSLLSANEKRRVLAHILSYLFSLISPHVSNRFFVREVYNITTGTLVLGALFNNKQLLFLMCTTLPNLLALRIFRRIKTRSRKALGSLVVSTGTLLAAFLLHDPEDNAIWLTLSAFIMKQFYLAVESNLESVSGVLGYYAYLLFTPGLLYGPVIPYAKYEKYVSQGYSFILGEIGRDSVAKAVGDPSTQSPEEVERKREDLMIVEFTKLIGRSSLQFFGSLLGFFLFCYLREADLPAKAALIMPSGPLGSLLSSVLAVEAVSSTQILFYVILWTVASACYSAAFIPQMENVHLLGLELPSSVEGIYSSWNVHGMKFIQYAIRTFRGEKEKSSAKRKRSRPPKRVIRSALIYLRTSLLAFAPILLFAPSLCSVLCFFITAIFLPPLSSLFLEDGAPGPARPLARLLHLLASKALFSYFILPFVTPDHAAALQLWKGAWFYGHFVSLGVMASKCLAWK